VGCFGVASLSFQGGKTPMIKQMRRAIVIAIAFGLDAQSFALSCPTEPSYSAEDATEMLTAEYAGSLIFINSPAFSRGALNPSASKGASSFEDGCYALDKKLQTKRLWFSINNHSENTSSPAYVGIQVIKLFPKNQSSKSLLVAFRNRNRPWYFQKRPLAQSLQLSTMEIFSCRLEQQS
jgi:hypothetical protein